MVALVKSSCVGLVVLFVLVAVHVFLSGWLTQRIPSGAQEAEMPSHESRKQDTTSSSAQVTRSTKSDLGGVPTQTANTTLATSSGRATRSRGVATAAIGQAVAQAHKAGARLEAEAMHRGNYGDSQGGMSYSVADDAASIRPAGGIHTQQRQPPLLHAQIAGAATEVDRKASQGNTQTTAELKAQKIRARKRVLRPGPSTLGALCAGIAYCDWLVVNNATNTVVYPRGFQVGYRTADAAQARSLYKRACKAGNDDIVKVLHRGSILFAFVGGDWSADNDFDQKDIDPTKKGAKIRRRDVCACFYGNTLSVCAKSAPQFVKMQYGPTFWMPLPLTKNVGPRHNTWVAPDMYVNWHGEMFVNKSARGPWGKIFDQWHHWRQWAIAALSKWDIDSDGNITTVEVNRHAQRLMNREWLSHADPCLVHNAAVYCNAFLKYLRKIQAWFEKYPFFEKDCYDPITKVWTENANSLKMAELIRGDLEQLHLPELHGGNRCLPSATIFLSTPTA